jgi:hypothetical protein
MQLKNSAKFDCLRQSAAENFFHLFERLLNAYEEQVSKGIEK